MSNKYSIGEVGVRHWGQWEVLDVGEEFCLKRLTLDPNKQISKQHHYYRDETWIIVSGSGEVLIEDSLFPANVGGVFYIEKNKIHQLRSNESGIVVIELQKGSLLDEKDIIRFK